MSDETTEAAQVELASTGDGPADPAPRLAPERYVPLRFLDVVMVLPSTHPVVILEETDPPHRQLRIPIGSPEGIAIAYAARGIDTPKPLTHELFVEALHAFGVTLEVVRITEVSGSAYGAELVLSSPAGTQALLCRPSDAIALALRQGFGAPITAREDVLEKAGFAPSSG